MLEHRPCIFIHVRNDPSALCRPVGLVSGVEKFNIDLTEDASGFWGGRRESWVLVDEGFIWSKTED